MSVVQRILVGVVLGAGVCGAVHLALLLVLAAAGALIMARRRSPEAWVALGAVGGIYGAAIVAALPGALLLAAGLGALIAVIGGGQPTLSRAVGVSLLAHGVPVLASAALFIGDRLARRDWRGAAHSLARRALLSLHFLTAGAAVGGLNAWLSAAG